MTHALRSPLPSFSLLQAARRALGRAGGAAHSSRSRRWKTLGRSLWFDREGEARVLARGSSFAKESSST